MRMRRYMLVVAVLGMLAAAPGVALGQSGPTVTYSYEQTIPVPPASTYAGSGGGDGWALAMTPDAVYNVFHHSSTLTVACHLQSDASSCWSPKTITDGGGQDFRVSGMPSVWLDQDSGRLYAYATRSSTSTAGVVCIDTTQPAEQANPYCGFTELATGGDAPSSSGVSNAVLVGTRWYAFNYVSGSGPAGGRNALMCFDTVTAAPCAGQPFAVAFGGDTVSVPDPGYHVPAIAAIGSRIIVPVSAGVQRLACVNAATGAGCGGSWPISLAFNYGDEYGSAFPTLSVAGEPTGLCLPSSGLPCFGLDGASAPTPSGMTAAIAPGTPWNGPAFTLGPRVYVATGGSDRVSCFNFSTGAGCENFPRAFPGLGYLYTVNADPHRPECIWVNADYGSGQIQNFDAYTGGSCGRGPIRVLASSIVVPSSRCLPTGYTSMKITAPARSTYTSGTITFLDGDGRPIPGAADRAIDGTGLVNMAGLDLSTATGLPQFLISLEGSSGEPAEVVVELVWKGVADPACVKPETNTRDYQALGDSFSSGFGNAPFALGTHGDLGPNDCQRSTRAYSQYVTNYYDLNLSFHACQGAVTKDLYGPRNSSWGEAAQLDHLDPGVGLVTFSIGGNDAHFATVVRDCIDGYELLPFNTCSGDDRVANPVREAIDRLGNKTATPTSITPYDRIFKDVRAKAPFSTRVAIGYPDFFPEDGGDRTFLPGGRCEGIKKADQRWIVERIHELDGIIRTTASRNGFRYADPVPYYDGHQLCSGGDEYFGGVLADNRFHPTVAGQEALGKAVVKALSDPAAAGGAFKVTPNETVGTTQSVPVGQGWLTIIATWPGSDVPLTLISPSGRRYTRDAPGAGVGHDVGPTWEQYEIPAPEPGEWKIELFGKAVARGGETVNVQTTIEPFPDAVPTARISYAVGADGALTFSGAPSSDPDGQIVKREWYVSTGSDDEAYSVGDQVVVPGTPTGKSVTLVVTDDRGQTAFASVVIPPPARPAAPAGPPVVTTPKQVPLTPARDLVAPKLTKVAVQASARRGKRTVWKSTTRLKGTVRLRLTLSETATVTLKLNSARTPTKAKTKTVKVTRAGVVTVDLRGLAKGLRAGKAKLLITAKDAAGNVTTKTLNVRR